MTYPENPPYTGGPDEVVPTGGLSATGIAALAAISAQDWEDELYGAADTFLTPISELLGKLFDLFAEFVDLDGFIEIASDVLGFFYNLLDRAGFFDLLSGGVDFFGWLVELGTDSIETLIKPIVEFLQWVWELIGPTLQDLIQSVIDFLSTFLNPQQFVELFNTIVQFFNGLFGGSLDLGGSIADFVNKLPLIGPLVSAITGKSEADGVALDLTTLAAWARGLEKQTTDGVSALLAAAGKFLGGTVSVSQVNNSEQNLLAQGDFLTSSTVDPGGGWSWDATRTRTGSGGSLKVACTGSAQRIYCRQDIKVVAGDRLKLNGYVGTNSFTSGSMRLSIQPWGPEGSPAVMTAKTVVDGTARTTAANTFQALPELAYTVPAGVTSIQVSVAVNCNSGAEVFFDDISLKKTGVLGQTLVTNLIDAFNGILAGAGYVFGEGWEFLQTAIGLVTGTANDAFDNTEATNTVLFDNPAGGTTVVIDALPVPGIGAQINPTAGSGAQISRRTTTNQQASPGDVKVVAGFYDHIDLAPGADIEILNSSNAVVSGTGTKANLAGIFRVTSTGWYLVEICIRLNPAWSGGGKVAPLLWRSANYPATPTSKYKMGADGVYIPQGLSASGPRFVQSSFIVYLPSGGAVQAGYNAEGTGLDVLDADSNGTETYFSISLLNKTYA